MNAIHIIQEEHRSLTAVLHGMLHIVRDIRYADTAPPFDVLEAMIAYIETFTERFHHPKEDRYLFRLLRLRYPDAAATLTRLESEHAIGGEKIRALARALADYRKGGPDAFRGFATAVADYAALHYDHMRTEESSILPLARMHLTRGDWTEVDAAFSGNADPLVGLKAGTEFRELFRQLVDLAPPPLGSGPVRRAR